MLWTADAEESLQGYKNSGGDGYGEADLGEGEDEGDDVGEDVEFIVMRNVRGRENQVGKQNAEGI